MKDKNKLIWPSIMPKNQKELSGQLAKASIVSSVVHLDFVDGKFAPNSVFQFPFRLKKGLEYSAHLMVEKPLPFVKKNKRRIQLFLPHFEVFSNPQLYFSFCQKEKIVPSFAILPKTSVTQIKPYLKDLDFILILTVTPGFYGSKFLKSQVKKISQVKNHIKKNNLQTKIIVDGGINPRNLHICKKAGADIFISGSFLMKSENIERAMSKLEFV